MTQPILQLGNSQNWEPLWNYSATAATSPELKEGSYYPIPPIVVPFLLENHTIAIATNSISAKPTWKVAGNIRKKISTGIVIGGTPDVTISDARLLFFNQINLFRFEKISTEYALEIVPKYYIKDISLQLFVYTGIDSDTTTEQLNRIEFAIDELNR